MGTWASSVSPRFLCALMQSEIGRQLLYMYEIIQSSYYFCHFRKDDWKLKVFPLHLELSFTWTNFLQTLVAVVLLVDTLSVTGDCICVYLVSVHFLCWTTRDYDYLVHDYPCWYVLEPLFPRHSLLDACR